MRLSMLRTVPVCTLNVFQRFSLFLSSHSTRFNRYFFSKSPLKTYSTYMFPGPPTIPPADDLPSNRTSVPHSPRPSTRHSLLRLDVDARASPRNQRDRGKRKTGDQDACDTAGPASRKRPGWGCGVSVGERAWCFG